MKPSGYILLAAALGLHKLAQAQPSVDAIVQVSEERTTSHYPELMFMHSDKNAYVSGEILWFRLYCLSGITMQPTKLSSVGYVDLVDANNKVVQSAIVSMADTNAAGSIMLPLQLPEGNYELRAYTRWMLNQPEKIYRKTIRISNALLESDVSTASELTNDFQVLPEGGTMAAGFTNRLGLFFQQSGRPMPVNGWLLSGTDTLQRFQLSNSGNGFIDLPTEAGKPYQVQFLSPQGKTLAVNVAGTYGAYVLQARRTGKDYELKALYNGGSKLPLIIIVQDPQHGLKSYPLSAYTGGSVTIPAVQEQAGVYTVTLYAGRQAVAERLIYVQGATNTSTTERAATTAGSRAAVQLNADSGFDNADCSISIYYADSSGADPERITDYMLLGRHLKGKLWNPEIYRSINESSLKDLEALLLTQGWRTLQDDEAPVYIPEYAGQIVDFDILNETNQAPAANMSFAVAVPGKPFKLQTTNTNADGHAQMVMPGLSGNSEFYLSAAGKTGIRWQVKPSPRAIPNFATVLPAVGILPGAIQNRSVAMQVQRIFYGDTLKASTPYVWKDSMAFYGKGSVSYKLDDYVRFQTMEEVLREYVREINVGVGGGNLHLRLWDELRREANETGTLVMWNGLPLSDPSKVFAQNPLTVDQITVIPRGYYVNGVYYKGLANFIGKNSSQTPDVMLEDQKIFKLEGVQASRKFFAPRYDTESARNSPLPDFRTTLVWEPHFNPGKSLSFYTGDRTGKFIAVVQGMKDGQPVYMEQLIEVK